MYYYCLHAHHRHNFNFPPHFIYVIYIINNYSVSEKLRTAYLDCA